jgi:hypothetical protein
MTAPPMATERTVSDSPRPCSSCPSSTVCLTRGRAGATRGASDTGNWLVALSSPSKAVPGAPTAASVAWGDNSHSVKGPRGQSQGVPEGNSVGYTWS